jgi:hypothetical protein
MSATFDRVRALVQQGEVRISEHGYDEMSDDDILIRDVLAGVAAVLSWKTIPRISRDRVFSYCKGTPTSSRSMSFGGFLKIRHHLRLSSPPTDLVPIHGLRILQGGKHEKKTAYKTHP